ncbi:putative oxidoreductase [Trichoderma arundinaceum]|uniref:Putative oxidoreductase n=1 Tax=Trichoderma arundinaceum TaxID=490622 RepID=A0A395P0Y2_TRIAR|nr:putative oxidoreductase [Trichoderma arundinaceum]
MAPLVWLVTGCSSGFGRTFVSQILARGDNVIATARKLESIQDLERIGAKIMQLDVTDDQQILNKIADQAIAVYGAVDVLVNNAAYASSAAWEDVDVQEVKQQFETNVFGVFKVTKAFLPHFRERKTGHLVFISSLVAWVGHQFGGAYAGSKFGLEGLVESLWRETSPLGIKTLLVEPGMFRTMLGDNMKSVVSKIPDYHEASRNHFNMLAGFSGKQPGDPEKGVSVILDFIRGEGSAAGRDFPFRLPLGADAYHALAGKCEETLMLLKQHKDVICSTDISQ